MKIDYPTVDCFGMVAADCHATAYEASYGDFKRSRAPPVCDWDFAVGVAAARLNEKSGLSDLGGHPILLPLAIELAALLCAYGMIADEADRTRSRAGDRSVELVSVGGTSAVSPRFAYGTP